MSEHFKPLTPLEKEGLQKHGLPIGTASQLSDCFRLGVAWALQHAGPSEPAPVETPAPLVTSYERLREIVQEVGVMTCAADFACEVVTGDPERDLFLARQELVRAAVEKEVGRPVLFSELRMITRSQRHTVNELLKSSIHVRVVE